jgi:signal transduction histidine kinase
MPARETADEPLGTQLEFLSSLTALDADKRRAALVVLISVSVFAVTVPYARTPLWPVPAFIPVYQSSLIINDAITAVLLFAQFSLVRAPGLLVLASAYLFTALIAFFHLLTFPGLFSPTGLLGAGPQSTAWIYMFWHGAFPLAVIAYARLEDGGRQGGRQPGLPARAAVLLGITTAAALACGFAALATAGQGFLPAIMQGNSYTPVMLGVVSTVWIASFAALAVLWMKRPRTVLDVWLMVVMCAWIFDVGLSAVFNAGRFDLGFYAGRIYGLLAASFVLVVLLLEAGQLHARYLLARARHAAELQQANHELERAYRELKDAQVQLIHTAKMTSLGELVAGIAHEINNPLAYAMAHLGTISSALGKLAGEATLTDRGAAHLDKARQRAIDARSGLGRVSDIVSRLRTFSRLDEGEFKDADLTECINSALEFMSHKIKGKDIEVQTRFAGDAPLYCAPGLLNQAFLNLLANAVDAVGERGIVRVRTGQDDQGYWVAIADSGPGVPDAIRDRIFEPFFTTKDVGEGTGLGLSITYRIIDRHKGTIDLVKSDLGGAEFVIRLPVNLEEHHRDVA